ncbi:hypothetical protein N7495_002544 [Penicillium taxi]|uniref:uncharacterized protein n=1 Tax=Penicillium taxi TaxID=168475 RepID=UPI00254577E1|nr:uncharacterized protein N7495_002544 [Penicillium taxi]KAJ5902016.1 hypothetical protein N7495_002544 [Penicillium taxi]
MNPFISWAILLVVAGSLGWYYTNGSAPKIKAQPVRAVVEKVEATVAPKKQKRKNKASEPAISKKPEVQTVVSPPTSGDEPEDDVDNKEMARRLAAIKNGISPAGPASKNQKKKAKKAAQLESGSHASSTGADADDDLSPAVSPVVNASTSAGYVSDMLEAPSPAASVLRVTGNVKSEPNKEKVQSFKQVETKKQRQQRLKNEARKEQVQEAEQERRKLLEKQLHTARESERREAARSQPATSNAWEGKDKANGTAAPHVAPAAPVQLLDTFEQAPATHPAKKWDQGLPSEEEQIRILEASNGVDDWTTISKKPKKTFGKVTESISEASASEPSPAPVPVEPRVTVVPTYLPDIMRSGKKGHPLDSDWAA